MRTVGAWFQVGHPAPFVPRRDMMAQANPAWAEKKQQEFDAILAIRPFDDEIEG